jgi:hypothetical protein
MQPGFAVIRQKVSKVSGVSRTWLEWEWSREDNALAKTLIVEVSFDTDPNSSNHDPSALRAINRVAQEASQMTNMVITHLRIVPKVPSSGSTRMGSPGAINAGARVADRVMHLRPAREHF